MQRDDLDDLLNIVQTGASIFNNVQKMNLAESQLIANENLVLLKDKQARIAQENKDNLTLRTNALTKTMDRNYVEITALNNFIERYDVNAMDMSKLDDEFRTKDADDVFKGLGIEYLDGFNFRADIAETGEKQLENYENLVDYQNDSIRELTKQKNAILDLNKDLANVRDDLGIQRFKGLEDIKSYISDPDNREKFGLSTDIAFEDIDWAEDVNTLARVFMKKKDTPSDVGFWDIPKPATMTGKGVNPKTGGIIMEEQSEDLRVEFGQLRTAYAAAKKIDDDNNIGKGMSSGGYHSEYLEGINIDAIDKMLSGKNVYSKENQESLNSAKDQVGQTILAFLEKSIDDEHNNKIGRTSDEIARLKEEFGFDKVKNNKGQMVFANKDKDVETLVLNAVVDKYIGNDTVPVYDEVTNTYKPEAVPRTKIPYGSPGQGGVGGLNEDYYLDKLYHGQKPPGMDDWGLGLFNIDQSEVAYGATSHDAVFYRLLKVYDRLDNIVFE